MEKNENLIPQAHVLTVEEQSNGGKASVKARRERKRLKAELEALLESGDTQQSIAAALIEKAKKGDVRAFVVIRDTIGEKPVDHIEMERPIIDFSGLTTEQIRGLLDEEV